METNAKQLRPYQARLITDVCRSDGHALVEQPTGSGKTLQIVTLVGMQLGQRFKHAVIAAPQEQIEDGFVRRDYHAVAFPDCAGVAVPAVAVPEELIWATRQSELGSVKRLLAYLRQPAPDHALACTHAAAQPPDRCRPAGRSFRQSSVHRRGAPRFGRWPVANPLDLAGAAAACCSSSRPPRTGAMAGRSQ